MTSTRSKKQVKSKIPKGYTDEYTTYELITKTTYNKPYKPLKTDKPKKQSKATRAREEKKYAMPVKIISDTSGRGTSGRKNKTRKSKRS